MTPARPKAEVTLRAIRPEDAEALSNMASLPGFRRGTLQMPFKRAAQTRTWIDGLTDNDCVVVAEGAGAPIGWGNITRKRGRMAHAGSIGMGVHDDWTGQGVGRAILTALLDMADNWWGLSRVELSVYPDNAPAIALYRSCGFVEEGVARAFAMREGALVDAIMMARFRGI